MLEAARKASGAKVNQAKAELEGEAEASSLQGAAKDLAGQVVRAVLPQAAGSL